jgi:hypothetical protein
LNNESLEIEERIRRDGITVKERHGGEEKINKTVLRAKKANMVLEIKMVKHL